MRILIKRLMSFLKTNEAQQVIWLDYCGYHLTPLQKDLTPIQALFLTKGRLQLYKDMNDTGNAKKHHSKQYYAQNMQQPGMQMDGKYGIPIKKTKG